MLDTDSATSQPKVGGLPSVVEMIMSALETAEPPVQNRRTSRRISHRVQATLHVPAKTGDRAITIYTRDANAGGIGLFSPAALAIGQSATLDVSDPAGRKHKIDCTVRRCRPIAPGWYEGAVRFRHEQTAFAAP